MTHYPPEVRDEPPAEQPPEPLPRLSRVAPWLLIALMLAFVAFVSLNPSRDYGPGSDADRFFALGPTPGADAPAFTARTLDGATLGVPDDFAGEYVLLDFWATWCAPCTAELPDLRAAAERFAPRGLRVVGISLDGTMGVSADTVQRFTAEHQLSWPQIYERASEVAQRYGVQSIPAPFLIEGASGKVLARGSSLLGNRLEGTLDRLLPADGG